MRYIQNPMNKHVPTSIGIALIFILVVTISVFAWKYRERIGALIASNDVFMQQPNIVSGDKIPSQINNTPSKNPVADCFGHENEKRICKDGTLISRFDDSKCVAVLCSAKTDENYYSPYVEKDHKIFYEEGDYALTLVDNADAKTFRLIGVCSSSEVYSNFYGRDDHSIYTGSKELKGIDFTSFKYLGLFSTGDGVFPHATSISLDRNFVYFGCGTPIKSIDRKSFAIITDGYSKDKAQVYYLDNLLSQVDYKTFQVIGKKTIGGITGSFALDKNHVYYEGFVLTGVQSDSCQKGGLEKCLPTDWKNRIDYSSSQGN